VLDGGDKGLLEGILGQIKVAEDADKRGQDAAILVAKHPLDRVRGRPFRRMASTHPLPSHHPFTSRSPTDRTPGTPAIPPS
jgi:hypothetical protein